MQPFSEFIGSQLLSITYMGKSDDEITHQLIGVVSGVIDSNPSLVGISKKTVLLIAESFQNVIRHGTSSLLQEDLHLEADYFNLKVFEDRIFLSSKNLVSNDKVSILSEKIKHVNQLNQTELKRLWMQGIGTGRLSEKGGAGLGIIEMARKTNTPLRAQFVEVDDSWSRFYLGLELVNMNADAVPQLSMVDVICSHMNAKNARLLLQYQGSFSEDLNPNILGMLETNLSENSEFDSEIIEQVGRFVNDCQSIFQATNSSQIPDVGEFSTYITNHGLELHVSSLIGAKEETETNNFIQKIKSIDLNELHKLKSSKENGLIKIAIQSKQKFECELTHFNHDFAILTIQVELSNNSIVLE